MKTPPFLLTVALAILLPLGSTSAKNDTAAQINKITDAHQEKIAAFGEKMQAASREEQRELYQTEYPKPDEAIEAVKVIVVGNPKDPAVIDGVVWMLRTSRGNSAVVDSELLGVIEEHHANEERVVEIAAALGFTSTPDARKFLQALAEKSEVKDVRGMALYSLAAGIERDPSKIDEYTTLMETVIKEHQDLEMRGRKVAKRAEGKLFAAKNLAIGKPAPEIIGKDVDGKEMKLSDYRGKIVVIDFWGDW